MTQAAPAAAPAKPKLTGEAAREARATPSLKGYALVLGPLLLFTAVAFRFDPSYFSLFVIVTAGFAVHYWLPFRFKEPFFLLMSVGGTAWLTAEIAGVRAALVAVALTLVMGAVIYGIFAAPLRYWMKVLAIAAIFAGFLWWGAYGRRLFKPPVGFIAVFGSAFCFRIFPYLYEARHFKAKANLRDFVRYFFMLPGFKLSTIDYQKLGQSRYARDGDAVAQQGVRWIARGAIQYAVWSFTHERVYWIIDSRDHITPVAVVKHLVLAYTLYLSVSSRIHLFAGVMHVFGYDLPEPYRWFAFAHSPLDFWRRANIYWKDIMLKVVFMPVYFALRKRGDLGAKLVAMIIVFIVTWFFHLWNDSWKGQLQHPFWEAVLTPQMAFFWGSYGLLCAGNVIIEAIAEKRAAGQKRKLLPKTTPPRNLAEKAYRYIKERIGVPEGMHPARAVIQIALMQVAVAMLFSFHYAPSARAFYLTISFWR